MKEFIDKITKLHHYLQDEVKDDIGMLAVEHAKGSFQNEGFSDKSKNDNRWKEVGRRQGSGDGAAAKRKILTGETGDLGRSPDYKKTAQGVEIISDKEYAQVHNEGGTSGRKSAPFKMPARPFIKQSDLLNAKIIAKIEKRFKDL
ncbi:phage virion morphogenesis protein [Persicobacter sp. CCB-QB2]|uniref:phage virion morphogenesis protein n=1 Tax=Persicobacter sp. CCB-QB2 TaxID=1561025 RepID=UPI0006A9894F|nr:phage virion morphogenesis protein [Persicobacter sp. CCB-QB2]